MGIELPPELAGVAAQAGVQWPQADEEKLRASATAWRQAGTQLTGVTSEADGTAQQALGAVQGKTGDAATAHWNTFVAPDTGHLTAAAQGAHAAADRLDHAADQVGAAKVQIVRHLVGLAKTNDAATAAANAGHPTALLGLDSAVRGTSASVASVNQDLTHSIRLDSAVAPVTHAATTATTGLTHAATGATSGLAHTADAATSGLGHTTADVTSGLAHTAGAATHGVAQTAGDASAGLVSHGAPGLVHGAAGGLGHTAGDVTTAAGQTVTGAGHGLGQVGQGAQGDLSGGYGGLGAFPGNHGGPALDPGHLAQLPTPPTGIPVATGGHHDFPGDPSSTGPLPIGPPGGVAPGHGGWGDPGVAANAPTPGYGIPAHGGHDHVPTPPLGTTVQSASAPVLDRPIAGGPAAFTSAPLPGPAVAPSAPAAGFSGGAPVFDAAPPPVMGGGEVPPVGGPGGSSGVSGPGSAWSATPSGPPVPNRGFANRGPDLVAPVDVPARQSGVAPVRQQPPLVVPGAPPAGAPGSAKPHQTELAIFLIYLFPLGHLPKATGRPHRQLPAPPPEVDYAAGLRFPPHDHPAADLVDDATALAAAQNGTSAAERSPGLGVGHPAVAPLADGYDPLGSVTGGGGNEHEWDRRFLVRPPGEQPAEFAWPPGELFPEGGCDEGEAEVLPEGTLIDRFGGPEGRVFAEVGTPFARRALPPERLDAGYRCYRVRRPLPVFRTLSAPWFGQPGGGVRYRATHPAADLEAMGYLTPALPETSPEPLEKTAQEAP